LLPGQQLVASFDAELADPLGPPASLHERDLRSLRAWSRSALAEHPLVAGDAELARGIAAIEARSGDAFSEWEGNVGTHEELAIGGTVLSATALETWAACPAHYLFKNVLGIREQDDVDDVDELEARHRGTLVHAVLERLGREHLGRHSADQLPLPLEPEFVPWTLTGRDAIERVADEVFAEFDLSGFAPYPILWEVEKRRIVRDVVRTLAKDDPDAMLLAVEHRFGGDEQPPFTLTLPSRRVLSFRGMIDRVDRLHDGLRVVDYKTGRAEGQDEVEAKIRAGTRLQLPLYGLAAQQEFDPHAPVDAGYWFVSAKGGWKSVSIKVDPEVKQRFLETLDTISTEIAEGVFPANPGPEDFFNYENCKWCEYDRICPADRDRAWLRLQNAPALKPYVVLGASAGVDADGGSDDE
jgi:RecB family exonuclease